MPRRRLPRRSLALYLRPLAIPSSAALAAQQEYLTSDMNNHQRQGRELPNQTTLQTILARALHITTEVTMSAMRRRFARPAPPEPDEVRTS